MVFVCPACQVENRQNAKFCRKCGRTRDQLEKALDSPSPGNEHVSEKEVLVPTAALVATFSDKLIETAPPDDPQCSSCWARVRNTDKYCFGCGEPQPVRSVPTMISCSECATPLPQKANYCFHCGHEANPVARRQVRNSAELFSDENSEFFPRFEA